MNVTMKKNLCSGQLEIHHPEYGKWCWISNTGDHFIVEVENCGGFLELAKCKSLIKCQALGSNKLNKTMNRAVLRGGTADGEDSDTLYDNISL